MIWHRTCSFVAIGIVISMEVAFLLQMMVSQKEMMVSQKEMQRQLSNAVNGPVTKEGKRLEVAIGRMIERSSKSNADALWARLQEEIVKNEKAMRDNSQQIVNATTNFMSKELNAMFEKTVKKEVSAIAPVIARAVTPAIEKTISSAITESFQVRIIRELVELISLYIVVLLIKTAFTFMCTERTW